ncbi:GNAT family N-acetyltransferase [Nitriliruptoraceae bacterium ZYF776]|nr:GNAT family N-acetyltransferase [Profundirhabdus halotolerans]
MIDTATDRDVPAAATVLAAAFADDDVVAAFVPRRRPRRAARLRELFTAVLRTGALHGGVVDLARAVDDGRVLGVAAWEAPDAPGGARRSLGQLPRSLRAVGVGNAPTALRAVAAMARARPSAPAWYLAEIGTGPGARGLGVGGALLRHRTARLDALGSAAYLEATTERSAELYARHGFRRLLTIGGVPGAQPIGMWRDPGTVDSS